MRERPRGEDRSGGGGGWVSEGYATPPRGARARRTCTWLVEEDDLGVPNQRDPYAELALVAAAEVAGARASKAEKVELFHLLLDDPFQRRAAADALDAREELEVLLHGEQRQQRVVLRAVP
jgi:hypothetical protein